MGFAGGAWGCREGRLICLAFLLRQNGFDLRRLLPVHDVAYLRIVSSINAKVMSAVIHAVIGLMCCFCFRYLQNIDYLIIFNGYHLNFYAMNAWPILSFKILSSHPLVMVFRYIFGISGRCYRVSVYWFDFP